MLYRWLRDLHLYFGLFVSPFVLLFAASVFYLNHGKLIPGSPSPVETYRAFEPSRRLRSPQKGREAVDRATAILPQVRVSGEIGYLRYVARDRHLIFPVSKAGAEATIDVDLDAPHGNRKTAIEWTSGNRSPTFTRCRARTTSRSAATGLALGIWRLFADATIYLLLFLSLSGVYLWWAIKAERSNRFRAARCRRIHVRCGLVYAVIR